MILGILAVAVVMAVFFSVKHFRGQGGCCGGGTYQPRKKRLKTVALKRTFRVEGMHCQNCVNRVMEAVNDIPGASAAVNLKKGSVTVSMERPIEDAVIRAAIEKGGYTVMGVDGYDDKQAPDRNGQGK